MLRIVSGALRGALSCASDLTGIVAPKQITVAGSLTQRRCFGALTSGIQSNFNYGAPQKSLLDHVQSNKIGPSPIAFTPARTVIKFSRIKGKRKTIKKVIQRFYRLDWGGWIRAHAGALNSQWKKRPPRRLRHRKLVMTNSTQSYMLDKMVTSWWRRPHFYPDDPYNPYHKREDFFITRRKPLP